MTWPTHILSASGIVFDGQGNVLLCKHPRRGWDFTGGQVENGENLEEGVLREILEESGVTATVRCLSGIYSNVRPQEPCNGKPIIPTLVCFAFLCDYVGGAPIPTDEALESLWVPREQVLDYVKIPISRLRYQHALEYNGRVLYCSYANGPSFEVLYSRFV